MSKLDDLLDRAMELLDRHLGDSDPAVTDAHCGEYDEYQYPDVVAYQELMRLKKLMSETETPEWISTKEQLPKMGRKYWITDGKNMALAEWSIENMWWKYLYHSEVFEATHMLEVKLPAFLNATTKGGDDGSLRCP